jgi:hypothetical protein
MNNITVACVLRQGGWADYDAGWVERLQNMVSRNLQRPHRFVCFSDCDVPCERIPLLPTDPDVRGWWAKMQLFRPGILSGPVLYLDLDTVISGSLDEVIDRVEYQDMVMWWESDRAIASSAIMWWRQDLSELWNIYCQDPDHWHREYRVSPRLGDQAFVSERVTTTTFLDHCPSEWFHIASKSDHRVELSQVRILTFRKRANKPSTMPNHPLVKAHWR